MERASDDVLGLLFVALLDDRSFIWLRTALPLVCKRWASLLRAPRPLFRHITVNAKAECTHTRRNGVISRVSVDLAGTSGCGGSCGAAPAPSPRTPASPPGGSSPLLGSSPATASSPLRGGWVGSGSPPSLPAAPHTALQRPNSASSMAVLCSGGSGSTGRCGLHHSASSSRVRARLSSRRVHAWLQPRAAAVASLSLDLTGAHDFTAAAVERLAFLLAPSLTRLRLAGAPVDASDCCEALGVLRGLRCLEITAAAPSVMGSGLMQLAFLPALRTLVLSLDIPPACPEALVDLPTGLASLALANMWLRELPPQLADLKGLTAISLDRCSLEADPVPLLLSLQGLCSVSIRAPPRPLGLDPSFGAAAGGAEVSRVALVECGLGRVPVGLASLVALTALDVSHNPELGADVANCLPAVLAALPGLATLSMAHCGLGQLPPTVGDLSNLTHLELAGNPLAALPRRPLACAERLVVLGLAATRLKALPAWILAAHSLRELAVSAACLAGPPPGESATSSSRGSASVSAALGSLSIGQGGAGGQVDNRDIAAGPLSSGWLRLLPEQLPGLLLLKVEGALWEAAAVRNLMGLLTDKAGTSQLRVDLIS